MLGEGLKPAGETLQEEGRREGRQEAEMQAEVVVVMLVLAVSAQASAHWPAPGKLIGSS